jgi:serine/threonine protein kinase
MLDTGANIAGYRIEGVLGRGGMAVVYEARQLSLQRAVALKILDAGPSADAAMRERFRREGLTQAHIDHPNIVSIYEAGEHDGRSYLAMQLIRGTTLRERMGDGPLDPDLALRLLTPVATALDHAHERGLVHRDIKPQNILIGPGDHVYLADFGLTKGVRAATVTREGSWVGTPNYMAPEQIRGEPAARETDVYALAAVLLECLTGTVPFDMDSETAVLYAHLEAPRPRVTDRRSDLPAAIDDVIVRGLARDAGERQGTAGELLREAREALDSWAASPPSTAAPAPTAKPVPPPADTVLSAEPPVAETVASPAGGPTRLTPAEKGGATVLSPPGSGPDATVLTPPERRADATVLSPSAPRARRGGAVLAVAAVVAVAVAAGAFLLGRSGGEEAPATVRASSLEAGGAQVAVPAGWSRSDDAIPGSDVQLEDAAGLAGPEGQGALVGRADGEGRELPEAVASQLEKPAGGPELVELGDAVGLRFADLALKGVEAPVEAYTLPTADGVVTILCSRSSGATTGCDRIAGSVSLTSGEPVSPEADDAYAKDVDAVMSRLNRQRRSGVRELRAARTSSGQASRARTLATSYRQARSALDDISDPPSPERHRAIVSAVRAAETAYGSLASAARRESRGSYASARTAVRRADARIGSAVRRLAALGYDVS